jgi:hypothetical protein
MKPTQLVAMILSVLLVYVLSPGPVNVWYSHHGAGDAPKAVMAFYAPLHWLYDHNSGVKIAYDWYFTVLAP